MENLGVPTICVKCKRHLSEEEKEMGLPLCQSCIGSLTDILMRKIKGSETKKIEKDVDNFSRFISSSGDLFKLDDITILQCCFNIFMKKTAELRDKNLVASQKIFKDAIKFMERELEKIDDNMNSDRQTSSTGNDNLVSMIDELIQKGMKSGNGIDTIEDIKKCIDEGKEKGDKKEENKDDKKNESSARRIKID